MRKFLSLAAACSLAFPAVAFAEELAPPEPPKEAADDIEQEYDSRTPVPGTSVEEEMPEAPKMQADMEAAQEAAEPEEGGHPFLDGLSWQIMASAFYRIGGYTGEGVRAGTYNNLLGTYDGTVDPPVGPSGYPYTNYNGFGLNFMGGDVMYTGDKFAIRLDLRFGPGAPLLTPIAPVKQAYASWMPTEKLSFDFGWFDTIYGAEVVDEWNNANYTRGALYFLRQPFNHMGVRMGAELSSIAGLTLMVTNGGVLGGVAIDDKEAPALGWQFGITPDGHNSVRRRGLREGTREVGIFVGGNHAPSGNNGNKDWANFFDVVVSLGFDWFHLLLNGDYYVDGKNRNAAGEETADFQYGHSLAFIFDASEHWKIGMRGEHLSGNDLYREAPGGFGGLATGTLTLRYLPVEYLVISLEGRGEWTTRPVYISRTTDLADEATYRKNNYAAILGVTAHIGN